jgi:VIT1/CCC1 family predicted Fe2+/Mn2+ transporter
MGNDTSLHELLRDHTSDAIRARLSSRQAPSYIGDAVLGAMDGTVTTFAAIAGATGAGLAGSIGIALGLANVCADGFSMAVGNYQRAGAERHVLEQTRSDEEQHVRRHPEGEREEIRQIFAAKGFTGDSLETIVDVLTADAERWVDTMLTEEHGLRLVPQSPLQVALVTFGAFALAGLVPILPLAFFLSQSLESAFPYSALATAVTFFAIGYAKARMVARPPWRAGAASVLLGVVAAGLAYLAGTLVGLLGAG